MGDLPGARGDLSTCRHAAPEGGSQVELRCGARFSPAIYFECVVLSQGTTLTFDLRLKTASFVRLLIAVHFWLVFSSNMIDCSPSFSLLMKRRDVSDFLGRDQYFFGISRSFSLEFSI